LIFIFNFLGTEMFCELYPNMITSFWRHWWRHITII